MLDAINTLDLETRVLIVDDNPGIREPTAAFLTTYGDVIDTAKDGSSMRAAMARTTCALVVLDVMMPGEDGLTILRSLDRATSPTINTDSTNPGAIDAASRRRPSSQ